MTSEQKKAVADRLDEIRRGPGGLTPDRVIADARDEGSPLHMHFEWDIDKAALEHWREQARKLIRSVMVVETTVESTLSVPRYVHDPRSDAQGYIETMSLATDRSLAIDALRMELKRAVSLLERVRTIAGAIGFGDDVERMIASAADLRERISEAA